MIDWYKDSKLAIFFSSTPNVGIRYVIPTMTSLEKLSIKEYPFICKTDLNIAIFDHTKQKEYKFTIPKGYCWNGSDIPRMFWRIIGPKSEPQYLISSCIHDYICEHHNIIDNDRRLSSMIFRACLLEAGVSKLKAEIMYMAVDNFQKIFCDWGLEFNK